MYQALDNFETPDRILDLADSAKRFLARYGTLALMEGPWGQLLAEAPPNARFDALLDAAGFPEDPEGFFAAVAGQIRAAKGRPARLSFKGKPLPRLLVYHLLESAMPGQALCTVKSVAHLTLKTGIRPENAADMEEVLETYPVRLSAHVIRQSMVSEAVAVQYLPFEDELDPTGHELTFDGHFKQGPMEQMYQNRVIFLLDMRCPVYCRFCFRKHKALRKEASPGVDAVRAAVDRVDGNSKIREILITGGEPLLNRKNLEAAVDGLLEIPHVEAIRIATRSLAYYPHLFDHHGGQVRAYLKSAHDRCRDLGKRLEIGIHMLHADEISVQTLEIIADLTASGIPVYVQTPFLKGVNHEGPDLGDLFCRLRQAGAQIYYIFTPCHPIHGTRKYWSPISLSFKAYAWMREHISDRCMPKLCTATPLGKMEWFTSGWAVEKDAMDKDHIWIRTPYTRKYFTAVTGDAPLPVENRENAGGTLDVKCLIDMGDDALFLRDEGPAAGDVFPATLKGAKGTLSAGEIQARFFEPSPIMESIRDTGGEGLDRVHRTRCVLTLDSEKDLSGAAADYLAATPEITDLIVRIPASFSDRLDEELAAVVQAVEAVAGCGNCRHIRLQWAALQTVPEQFHPDHIAALRTLNRFDIASPFRLEFETWWLAADQITQAHSLLFSAITDAGMGVYANTALILGINTDPETAESLVHEVRRAGMEFHHVYTGGLNIQKRYNGNDCIPMADVVALASRIRMNCTGREVPLYVAWTPEGDRDFGLG